MSNVITIGNDIAVPARFITFIQMEKEPVINGYAVKVFMTDGVPSFYQSFATEAEARAVFNKTVRALEEYYAE